VSRSRADDSRFGNISAAVFEEHIKTANGSPRTVVRSGTLGALAAMHFKPHPRSSPPNVSWN
jgi:hypothetical protein